MVHDSLCRAELIKQNEELGWVNVPFTRELV